MCAVVLKYIILLSCTGEWNHRETPPDATQNSVPVDHHITLMLHSLHYLPIKYQNEFQILVLIFKAFSELDLCYLAHLLPQ